MTFSQRIVCRLNCYGATEWFRLRRCDESNSRVLSAWNWAAYVCLWTDQWLDRPADRDIQTVDWQLTQHRQQTKKGGLNRPSFYSEFISNIISINIFQTLCARYHPNLGLFLPLCFCSLVLAQTCLKSPVFRHIKRDISKNPNTLISFHLNTAHLSQLQIFYRIDGVLS